MKDIFVHLDKIKNTLYENKDKSPDFKKIQNKNSFITNHYFHNNYNKSMTITRPSMINLNNNIQKIDCSHNFFLIEEGSDSEDCYNEDTKQTIPSLVKVAENIFDPNKYMILTNINYFPKEAKPGLIITGVEEWVTEKHIKYFLQDVPTFVDTYKRNYYNNNRNNNSNDDSYLDIRSIKIFVEQKNRYAYVQLRNFAQMETIGKFFLSPIKKLYPTLNSKKEKMEVYYAYNILELTKNHWYGVILRNLPDCTDKSLYDFTEQRVENGIKYCLKPVLVDNLYCALVVCKELEYAEKLCFDLNNYKVNNKFIKAHLHPNVCRIRNEENCKNFETFSKYGYEYNHIADEDEKCIEHAKYFMEFFFSDYINLIFNNKNKRKEEEKNIKNEKSNATNTNVNNSSESKTKKNIKDKDKEKKSKKKNDLAQASFIFNLFNKSKSKEEKKKINIDSNLNTINNTNNNNNEQNNNNNKNKEINNSISKDDKNNTNSNQKIDASNTQKNSNQNNQKKNIMNNELSNITNKDSITSNDNKPIQAKNDIIKKDNSINENINNDDKKEIVKKNINNDNNNIGEKGEILESNQPPKYNEKEIKYYTYNMGDLNYYEEKEKEKYSKYRRNNRDNNYNHSYNNYNDSNNNHNSYNRSGYDNANHNNYNNNNYRTNYKKYDYKNSPSRYYHSSTNFKSYNKYNYRNNDRMHDRDKDRDREKEYSSESQPRKLERSRDKSNEQTKINNFNNSNNIRDKNFNDYNNNNNKRNEKERYFDDRIRKFNDNKYYDKNKYKYYNNNKYNDKNSGKFYDKNNEGYHERNDRNDRNDRNERRKDSWHSRSKNKNEKRD